MRDLKEIVVRVEIGNEAVAGVVPIDDVIVVAPDIPPSHEVHVEAVGEGYSAIDVLSSEAMQRLCSMQNRSCVVLVGRAVFEPAGIFEARSLKIFAEQIALRAQRIRRNSLRRNEYQDR